MTLVAPPLGARAQVNFTLQQYHRDTHWQRPAISVYSEHLLVGYRYYDARALGFHSGFPFGHGLSYTNFTYSDLEVWVVMLATWGSRVSSGL